MLLPVTVRSVPTRTLLTNWMPAVSNVATTAGVGVPTGVVTIVTLLPRVVRVWFSVAYISMRAVLNGANPLGDPRPQPLAPKRDMRSPDSS